MGWDLPYTKRTGNAGAVRDLIKGADLAIANFENPAPGRLALARQGHVFSANPKHIAGLVDAGIDWVSLANNHIGDAGRDGHAPDDEEPRQVRDRARRASARTTRPPTRRRCSRRAASPSGSWATTRSRVLQRGTDTSPAARA